MTPCIAYVLESLSKKNHTDNKICSSVNQVSQIEIGWTLKELRVYSFLPKPYLKVNLEVPENKLGNFEFCI